MLTNSINLMCTISRKSNLSLIILILHFNFVIVFGGVAMMSYLTSFKRERDLKSRKWWTLNFHISRTSWHMKVSDGSFFWIFQALSLG